MKVSLFLALVAVAISAVLCQDAATTGFTELVLYNTQTMTIPEEPYWVYYWYDMPESDTYAVTVTLTQQSGAVELYARYLTVPSQEGVQAYDFFDTVITGNNYQVTIPACAGDGPWYIGVFISTGPATYSVVVTPTTMVPQPLPINVDITRTIANQNYQLYYFDAPDNNSVVGVSLVDPAQVAGATALYLRPMMCPTMFNNMRAAMTTGVQTAVVSCTETMGGRWFVGVASVSGVSTSYRLRATQSPYIDLAPGALTSNSVASPTGWLNYRLPVARPSALQVTLSATTAHRSLMMYLDHETCSVADQAVLSGGLTTTSSTGGSVTKLFPVAAGSWYIAVTGDCAPAATCPFTLDTEALPISCEAPTATEAPFCSAAGIDWAVGNYTDIPAGDAAASASFAGRTVGLANPLTTECAYVLKMWDCAAHLPKCGTVGLPTLPCRQLCYAFNECTGSSYNCDSLTQFGRGFECSAPAKYSAASAVGASGVVAVMAVVACVMMALLAL